MTAAVDTEAPELKVTARPEAARRTQATDGEISNADALSAEVELELRAHTISIVPVYVDLPDRDLHAIMDIALRAYNKFVLLPTRNTWRKEEGSRRELEREVERTAMRDIAEAIKKQTCALFGGSWHVVYGRDFATYVTHKRLAFCQFELDGANVVVWRHG